MWLVLAFLSAGFAGITAILAKIGLRNVNSNLATALRTIVVISIRNKGYKRQNVYIFDFIGTVHRGFLALLF